MERLAIARTRSYDAHAVDVDAYAHALRGCANARISDGGAASACVIKCCRGRNW
jgi:hypothetical protein